MSHPLPTWRRWRGWLVGVLIFLIGICLILSDRVAARTPGRPWITQSQTPSNYAMRFTADSIPGQPWPDAISQIAFPDVDFHGSKIANIIEWIERKANINLDANWHALASVGISGDSTFLFDGKGVPLPVLLDALLKYASEKVADEPKLVWEAQPGRVVYLTTAKELHEEHRCRAQRQKEAPPALHKALDRKIPYVKLRDLTVGEALRYCQSVSGIKFNLDDPAFWLTTSNPGNRSQIVDVITDDVTFEQLLELILHRNTGNEPGAFHFTVEGDALRFFRDKGEK